MAAALSFGARVPPGGQWYEVYVLVAQEVRRVEVYRRKTGWDLEVYETGEDFNLRSVGLDLTLAEVYEEVLETP